MDRRQRCGIQESQIDALPCQRVNAMRRISDENQTRPTILRCMARNERQRCALAVH